MSYEQPPIPLSELTDEKLKALQEEKNAVEEKFEALFAQLPTKKPIDSAAELTANKE